VIPILQEHGGVVISASFNEYKTANEPDEIHVIQFPSMEKFDAYKNDVRIIDLASLKAEMIQKMDVFITKSFHQY